MWIFVLVFVYDDLSIVEDNGTHSWMMLNCPCLLRMGEMKSMCMYVAVGFLGNILLIVIVIVCVLNNL